MSKIRFIGKFVDDKSGATAIEYALIASRIVVALVTALTSLSGRLSSAKPAPRSNNRQATFHNKSSRRKAPMLRTRRRLGGFQ